jgi:competence protein ComEC
VALYETARPSAALIAVGENTYGHPRREILDALDGLGARTARTDENGLVALWGEGAAVRVWRERIGVEGAG